MTSPFEILLVDDDPVALGGLRQQIEAANLTVRTAVDGLQGLAGVMMRAPDLLLVDAHVPKMDGLGLLRAVRGNERTRAIPVFVLVGTGDGHDTSAALAGGADLVLTKPVERERLLAAIEAHLGKRAPSGSGSPRPGTRTAPDTSRMLDTPPLEQHTLPANFAQFVEEAPNTMIGESILDPDVEPQATRLISKRNTVGTVLFSDIRNFTAISEKLGSEEVVEMLNAYFLRACEPIQRQHGWVVKFLGDGLVALFESPPGHLQDHAERAVKAGLLMVLAAVRFRAWIAERHPGRLLPEFAIGVGIHTGEVTVCKMGGAESPETTIIGDTVNTAARLEEKTKEFGWSCVASKPTYIAAGARILRGRSAQLTVKGRMQPIDVVEVTGLQPKSNASEHERRFYEAVANALNDNSSTLHANAAARAALSMAGRSSIAENSAAAEIAPRIPGYQLERKLGEGGMSPVWLARRKDTGEEVVLKLLPITNEERDSDRLQRFIQEYSLISQIDHPNVAKIYEQGFTESHAYIAMEYFPGGDLRSLTKDGLKPDIARAVLIQVAGALAAIHNRGIVHRDMKPDNVMLRDDGTLGLADFGIAKHISANFSHTRHGEIFGTPYYLSPEQALGQPVNRRSDIYSLGVMLFEMLTGRKPYHADNAQALLYQHVHAPVPILPTPLARFQPLLARMMAKRPQERFGSAEEIIEAVIAA